MADLVRAGQGACSTSGRAPLARAPAAPLAARRLRRAARREVAAVRAAAGGAVVKCALSLAAARRPPRPRSWPALTAPTPPHPPRF